MSDMSFYEEKFNKSEVKIFKKDNPMLANPLGYTKCIEDLVLGMKNRCINHGLPMEEKTTKMDKVHRISLIEHDKYVHKCNES